MDKGLQDEIRGWQDRKRQSGIFKLPKYKSTKESSDCVQVDSSTSSPKMRQTRNMRRAESLSRTPSPSTMSKRKRGIRASLWNNTGSLPFGGAWISAASFDVPDDPHLDYGISSFVLDPVEHAWMIMAADGNYEEVKEFLEEDPHLLDKRDFVTGYSMLHWIAKHGHHEDLINFMDFASASGYPLDVNCRASGGLTPLHIAAMQGHGMVIKMLVGAYGADVHIRDQNGRKAWQYLRTRTTMEFKELLGAPEEEEAGAFDIAAMNNNNNCYSANTKAMALQSTDQTDFASKITSTEGVKSRMKPNTQVHTSRPMRNEYCHRKQCLSF
uniref:Sosondowah ankyrin repeat domain family member D n=1 Tax=Leptobrachium leishanense TaxID=445787 RepID=A0A8C5PGH6_9ANUR